MKKLLLLCLLSVMLVTGCELKMDYEMTIRSNKSMDFELIVGMDDELLEAMMSMDDNSYENENSTKEYTEEEKWAYLEENLLNDLESEAKNKNYKIERYENDGLKGVKYIVSIDNIDKISSDNADFSVDDITDIENNKLFIKKGNTYTLKMDFSDSKETEEAESYNVGVSSRFILHLPQKPISHNASSVSEDGKTLTWDLLTGNNKSIEAEFKLNNYDYLIYGGIAAVLVVVVILVVLYVSKNKKNKNSNSNNLNNNITNSNINNPVNPTNLNNNTLNTNINNSVNPTNLNNNTSNANINNPVSNSFMQGDQPLNNNEDLEKTQLFNLNNNVNSNSVNNNQDLNNREM